MGWGKKYSTFTQGADKYCLERGADRKEEVSDEPMLGFWRAR